MLIETPAGDAQAALDAAMQAKLCRRINAVRDAIAQACAEVGCTCLARRISPRILETGYQCCPVRPASGGDHPVLDLLPLLPQLSGALSQAGYYDTALECATMARHNEPVLDLDLTRAFLHLVLGDTDEARQIYSAVVLQHGGIPQRAVERIAELAATHADEEDIAELHEQLRQFIKRSL